MVWEVLFHRNAKRFLTSNKTLQRKIIDKIFALLNHLRNGTRPADLDIKKLRGKWYGFFRLRVGDIRIIFRIDWDKKAVFVYWIGRRGGAYK